MFVNKETTYLLTYLLTLYQCSTVDEAFYGLFHKKITE